MRALPSFPPREWKAVLAGYFDDSGHESDSGPGGRFYCTAGYLSDEQFWAPLANMWGHLLMQHGLQEIHMKNFYREARARGWDEAKTNAVLGDFVDVIRQSKVMGFGVGIDVKFWRGQSKERRRTFGTAAEFAMQRVLRMMMDKLETVRMNDDVGVIFDQDRESAKPRLGRYFNVQDLDRLFKQRVIGISFVRADRCYPLQAADILAWQTRRDLIIRNDGLERTHILKQMLTPLPGEVLHYQGEYWDESSEPDLARAEAQLEEIREAERRQGGAKGEG
jgi:hypothetical protein